MKCVLLAAGYGTRLGELTKDKPKPMVDIDGRPMIEHTITRLAQHNIIDLIVNLHYLPEIIPNHLHQRALYYYEPRILGHEKTISNLRHWLDGEAFMVVNADTITDLDYTDMIRVHEQNPHMITMAMEEHRATGTWIYPAVYFKQSCPIRPYRPRNLFWIDSGTPERLAQAKAYFKQEKP